MKKVFLLACVLTFSVSMFGQKASNTVQPSRTQAKVSRTAANAPLVTYATLTLTYKPGNEVFESSFDLGQEKFSKRTDRDIEMAERMKATDGRKSSEVDLLNQAAQLGYTLIDVTLEEWRESTKKTFYFSKIIE